jgi:hypothetical protein
VLCSLVGSIEAQIAHDYPPLVYCFKIVRGKSNQGGRDGRNSCRERMGEMTNACWILLGTAEGNKPLGRRNHRLKGNITYLK